MNSQPKIQLFPCGVAESSSPASDLAEERLDSEELLVPKTLATFYCRATGDSMRDIGIHEGDLLEVNGSFAAEDHDVVVASINGEITVRRLVKTNLGLALAPENPDYPLILIQADDELKIWGVVTFAITGVDMPPR